MYGQEKTEQSLPAYGWLRLKAEFLPALTTFRNRSWYTAFLNGDNGDIKCGKEIIPVKGVKPADINIITEAINKAYEKKYLVKRTIKNGWMASANLKE